MDGHLSSSVAEGRSFRQIIGGKALDAVSGLRIDVVSPSDGQVFASIPASGQDFVRIRLMTDIPDQPVLRRIEDMVQRQQEHYESVLCQGCGAAST